jgi:hypothetical protein
MRAASGPTLTEELTKRVAELMLRVAELTRRLEAIEVVRSNGRSHPHPERVIHGADDSSNPIEYFTENGFVIVRPWEVDGWPAPSEGCCLFTVSDPNGNQRTVTVKISRQLITATALHTKRRIDHSSGFWICCAERHLANYVDEHDRFPDASEIIINDLDREDLLLAIRWGKSG